MRILTYRLPELQSQIEKFNKKATKWGLPPVTYQVTAQEVEERKSYSQNDEGEPTVETYHVEVTDLEIAGDIPRIAGWSIHSKVQPSEVKGQNYVFTTANHAPVEMLRTCAMFCDHCQTKRLKNTAYFIQNEDGRTMLVGATCLRDFLPGIAIETLLAYLDNFKKVGEFDEDRVPRSAYVYPLHRAITDAYVAIKKHGFVSRSKADETGWQATASFIDCGRKEAQELYKGVDTDKVDAEVAGFQAHMMAKDAKDNDFLYNVQLALQAEYVRPKLFGYIAAAVNVWLRDLEQAAREKAPTGLNEWWGDLGTRYMLSGLRITRLSVTEGVYGATYITGLVDSDGRDFTWFASKKIGEVNDVINLKGTVKAHDEFRGRKQTVLTRCTKY